MTKALKGQISGLTATSPDEIRKQIDQYHEASAINNNIESLYYEIHCHIEDCKLDRSCPECKKYDAKMDELHKRYLAMTKGKRIRIPSYLCLDGCGDTVHEGLDGMNGFCHGCIEEKQNPSLKCRKCDCRFRPKNRNKLFIRCPNCQAQSSWIVARTETIISKLPQCEAR